MNKNKPVEYEEGSIEFFYNEFTISEDTMIPRLETESLVRKGIQIIKDNNLKTIIDIGTGSGTIPISMSYHTDAPEVYATDISEKALKIAKQNFTNILGEDKAWDLFPGSLLEPVQHIVQNSTDLLISANLPYVREGDFLDPEVLEEPHVSLFGGPRSGFELYEVFYDQIEQWLADEHFNKSKWNLHVICEFGNWHRDIAEEIFENKGWDYEFFEDGRGFERFVYLKF